MRIVELQLSGNAGWPSCRWHEMAPGLNVVYGGVRSGKTTLCELLAHLLYGQAAVAASLAASSTCPEGEVVVEGGDRHYRLRRQQARPTEARLTVSALDGSPVERGTVRTLVGHLPPTVLGPLCAVSFASSPTLSALLSSEFATGFQTIAGAKTCISSRRVAELAVRRDQLAHELETRIAGERRASKELDGRWRELDRLVRAEHELSSAGEAQLHSIEAALAETDARLRYRRLELNTDLRWASDGDDREQILAELDEQITRWRATMAELAKREATARARLALLHTEHAPIASPLAEQQAWLAVARQLSADLAGEISRLARASASKTCVCQDAHPRLRPIAETIQRQLEVLESLLTGHRSELDARDLRAEVEYLSRAEGELQQHVDHLLNRRGALIQGARTPRLHADHKSPPSQAGSANSTSIGHASFSAADLDQLEQRRMELEQERFQLVEQARTHRRKLRDLRAQRDTVSRQRAALLSVRSIEHVQRELAGVQRKLEQATDGAEDRDDLAGSAEHPSRASDYLAQLTDGKLVRLALVDQGRRAHVMTSAGESIPVEALSAAERDQVYLSLCLSLLSAAARRGVWLPLLLDDPFVRLDARSTASLAAVLEAFCRQGHQVVLFTGQQAAAERLSSLGIAVRDIASLRYVDTAPTAAATTAVLDDAPGHVPPSSERQREPRRAAGARRKKATAQPPRNGKATAADQSDAA